MNKFYHFFGLNSLSGNSNAAIRLLLLVTIVSTTSLFNAVQAQVNVTSTGGTTMASYSTLAAAVTAINSGTHSGTITVNVDAGHTETLAARINLTASGTMANPITIQKSGAGANPVLTAYTGVNTASGDERDGMFSLSGSDWVTIDGIDLQDAGTNTDPTTTMEYGYGLFKNSDTDGCQNNTIKNCSITLNRINNTSWTGTGHNGSCGIVSLNCTATANAAITVTAASGSNSSNKLYGNTIQNCNAGIVFIGYSAATPFDLGDTGNDIGGTMASTGNTILNFGGGAATNPATGIFANNQWGLNCSRNTINNNNGSGVNHATTLRGIFLNASSTSASANCNFNTITIKGGGTTSQVSGIENSFGSTAAGNTINLNNNSVTGEYLTATTGVFYGIYSTSSAATVNLNNNTVSNISYSGAALTGTGTVYGIYNSGAATNVNANSNTVSNITRIGTTGGTTIGIYLAGGTNQTAKLNNVNNLSIDGTGTTSTMYGIQTTTGTIVVDSNQVNNLKCLKTTGSSALYGVYNISSPTNENFNYNEIHDLIHSGTGTTYGLFTNTVTGTRTVSNNTIYTIITGGTTVAGIQQTTSSPNVFNNKIYNIQSNSTGAPTVSGLAISTLGTSGVANIYNNLISDLKAPNASSSSATAPTIRGINITVTTATSMLNLSYNTVLLNASTTGANFATTALWATTSTTATSGNLTLKNNIFVNLSTPAGTGNAAAYQRSSTALNNYNDASNNNLFYAGTPGATRLIFFDGTNADQTLAAFKTRVASRETNSVSENPTFLSTSGSSADFLHLDPAVPTQAESGGINVAGITKDYDGVIRQGNAGYAGTGSAPDIGADEGNFIALDLIGPAITYTNISNSICTTPSTLSATITDATGINTTAGTKPRIWFKKSTENNALPASNTAADNGWKYVEASNAISPFTFTPDYSLLTSAAAAGDIIEYFVVAQDIVVPPNVGTNTAIYNSGFVPASVALAAAAFPVSGVKSYTILANPVTITTIASKSNLCISENVLLSLGGDPSIGAEYQWQSSPGGANNWTTIPGANAATYNAIGVNTATDFRCIISCGGVPISASPSIPVSLTVNDPQILTTTPGQECGPGPVSVTLGATANAGSTVNWYSASTGGTSLGTGTTFSTPPISTTTSFYAEANQGGTQESGGRSTYAATPNTMGNAWGLVFNVVNTPITLQSVDVYAVGATTGTFSVQLTDNTGTVLQTVGPFDIPTGSTAAPVTVTLPLNLDIPIGTGYRLLSAATSGGALIRETSGISYPYASPSGNVVVTSGYIAGTTLTTYYWFYNWQVSTGCAAPRVPVVATVINDAPTCPADFAVCVDAQAFALTGGTPTGGTYSGTGVSNGIFDPATAGVGTHTITYTYCSLTCSFDITVNPLPTSTITIDETSGQNNNDGILCAGASATLTASGGSSYAWSTNETTAAINVSTAGSYSVTVTSAAGCVSSASTTISVNPLPTAAVTPSSVSLCTGESANLTASGGTSYLWAPGGETTATISVSAAGSYTVVATDSNGCSDGETASVAVNAIPSLSFSATQPTGCTTNNGAIDLTVSGPAGPYAYNWATSNGSGLVNGQEDQSGLIVGTYNVTVTADNTCSATLAISLAGPGNCDACPVVGALSANPSGVCVNETTSLTASGLVDMTDIYGITFKYFDAPTMTPYTGGTVIATVPNGSLTNNFTVATTSTSFATGGTYYIYAILDQNPTDPACRPFAQTVLTVVNTPSVFPVLNQTLCSAASTTAVNFSGPVPGTIFNWTNNNTGIGLAASGTGDIASFAAANATSGPITATITVTPVTSPSTGAECTGAPITFNITVNPIPQVNAVSNQTYCTGASVPSVAFTSSVPGAVLSWSRTNEAIGLGATSGTGNVPAFTAANAGATPLTSTFTVVASFTNNGVTCTGTPIQFTLTVNPTPTVAAVSNQVLCNGAATTAVTFSGTATSFNWTNNNAGIGLAASGSGNIASFTATNAGGAPVVATITVTPVYLNNGVTCTGTPTAFTVTVNPTAQVNQPANLTTCGGANTTVNFTTTTSGTTYTWTNSNTAIGLAAGGTGNISFVATTVAVSTTATITVTPNYTNAGVSCPGTPKTFTITVDPLPTVNAVPSQTWCSGEATTAVSFSGSITGTVFNWTNNNTSIGLAASGTGNIASFVTTNTSTTIQVATITVTPVLNTTGGSCPGTSTTFNITVYPRPIVNVGVDQVICQNQVATLTALLGGGATGGSWTGGAGVYGDKNSANSSYTPAANEYGTTITLTFTSNDPAGPCPAVSDALQLTVNTLPIVNAGADAKVCDGDVLTLSTLGATITANGSGVSTGSWSTSGTGSFLANNSFPGAATYAPSAADYAAGFVTLTLTSGDPVGPCSAVSDAIVLTFKGQESVVCNDNVQVSLDPDGIAVINPDMVLEGSFDDDFFTVDVYQNNVSFGNTVNCTHVGKTFQVRVTDNCTGNFCWGTIKVEDKLAPVLTCTDVHVICAVTNYEPAYLLNTLNIQNAYPAVAENCPPATLTFVDDWFDLDCDAQYSARILRKWTAVDASGNKGSCTQNIYFDRRHVTDVLFPADVTISCNSGGVNTTPSATGAPYLVAFGRNWPVFPNAGNCEMQSAYVDQVLPVCDGTVKILRTWTVYDWCLPTSPTPPTNPSYYIQVIKVVDDQGPTLACPANITVSTDPFNCCGTPNLPDVVVEDACSRINSAAARVVVRDPETGVVLNTYDIDGSLTDFAGNNLWAPDTLAVFGYTPCLSMGVHTVTYTVADDCGNTSTCSYRLTVEDATPPVSACDEFTQVALGGNGEAFINASTFDDGSYDNCSAVHFKARRMFDNECQDSTFFYDQVKFCCSDINDTILVVFRVYDVEVPDGEVSLNFEDTNANDCMVQVFVEDKIKPICTAPAHVTVNCENFDPSLWATGFATATDNCCIDTITVTNNLGLFDTVCNKGTITRTFRAIDCGGQSSTCTQRIIVTYEQDYFVKFPNDVIVTVCDGTGNYGEPTFFGEDCELLGVSHEDEIFTVVPDACFKIERTWTIINWCTYNPNLGCTNVPNPNPNSTVNHPSNLPGPTVSAAGTPAPWNPTVVAINPGQTPTNYSTFWAANANCYKYKQIIKVIDTQDPVVQCPASPVEVCDLTANDGLLWNEMYWYDATINSHDLCEAPTDLCITATDLCSGANVNIHYLLFLDLDGDGTMESVVNSINTGIAGLGWNAVPYGNAANPNYAGGTIRQFDGRPVLSNQKYGFALQTTVTGINKTACVRWNTQQSQNTYVVPELPYGTHKIKWFIEDGCGNETICEYTFVVKDCKKPTVVCINGLSVNIMPTKMIALWDTDFLQYTEDNCTPGTQLKTAIRKSGTGTGFPLNPDGTPQKSVVFTCDELGTQLVELWSVDVAGNADYCETYVIVQDNAGICSGNAGTVAGALKTEAGNGLEDAQIGLSGQTPGIPPAGGTGANTDENGNYLLAGLPFGSDYTITPAKDNDPLNGVSTFDLVLINKHILGLEPLNTPFKMIAADANNSRSITTFDIVELRKLILGIYTELPNNTSWRFVDEAYQFPNQSNPFQEIFPETVQLADLQGDKSDIDFVSVKVGDVNGNAVTSTLLSVEDRTDGTLLFDVTPSVSRREVKAGEQFTLTFRAAEKAAGYQFTLYYPNLEVVEVTPGAEMTTGNFGIFAAEHALTTSFNQDQVAGEFSVTFRATAAGEISKMLTVSSRITKAEAYRANDPEASGTNDAMTKLSIALRFNGDNTTITGLGFELYQNAPNPWLSKTQIGFYLPEAAEATLTIFDETGRTLFTQRGDYSRGYNAVTLDRSVLRATGVLYYKVETANDSAVKKMIQVK